MNHDVEVEARPRPLSTGIWTLFSWLRRDDRSESSDSLSSAGSDRTVASFAFLTPARYQPAKVPLIVPPPGPPTDSYKKRVLDRNLRRHHDRDITLHRKYGLFKSEGTCGYDAFSLPPVRRANDSGDRWDRERRATSECYQRRLAHVPGKRKAPLPPGSAVNPAASLPRRYTRKRPAPQPPIELLKKNKDNSKHIDLNASEAQMSSNVFQDKNTTKNNDVTMGCKSEKYIKKDASIKDIKNKSEKSFLKQIFDSKKRNSCVDTSTVKLLPSISELDKQAAELIKTCKLKAQSEHNNNIAFHNYGSQDSNQVESWFCVRCLRKYDSSVVSCVYCSSKQKLQFPEKVKENIEESAKSSNTYTQTEKKILLNKNVEAEDKQKLKEMLKEMKDSLPKRPKHDLNSKTENKKLVEPKVSGKTPYSTETPTLRVGSTTHDVKKTDTTLSQPSTSKIDLKSLPAPPSKTTTRPISAQAAVVAQVISAYKNNLDNNLQQAVKLVTANENVAQTEVIDISVYKPKNLTQANLNTPLRISSLLNPIYVPKKTVIHNPQMIKVGEKNLNNEIINPANPAENSTNKGLQVSQNVLTPSPSDLVVASTSATNVLTGNKDIKEVKSESNLETTLKAGIASPSKDDPSIKLAKTRKDLESTKPENNVTKLPPLAKEENAIINITQDQHSRRRDLINQLEKSIAQGDERAAAEAAAKLAQLRLSCSVLSFSSQILSQPSTSSKNNEVLKGSKGETGIVVATRNSFSSPKVNDIPQASKSNSIQETSPPKVSISKVNPAAVFVPEKVTTPLVSKTDLSKVKPVEAKRDENIQRNENYPNKKIQKKCDETIRIAVLVEDREATRGPVHLEISRLACVRDLRKEAETSLGLAANLQRWIVGRALCVDDNTPVISLAGPDFKAPFYLCVVESETKIISSSQQSIATASKDTNNQQKTTRDVYMELMQLEQKALVPNAEHFECGVCMERYTPGEGVVLRECVHTFCRDCLSDVVRHCEEPNVSCPAMGCQGMLQEREIRALVSAQDYERWLARGLAAAESGTRNAFHCRTRDCKGWALCEPGVQRFPCPVCKCINCVPCQAIHDGDTCEQHRDKVKQAANKSTNTNETDDGTRTLLNSLISKGEALECPECSAIITKKWGCDWVKCSACKTEICWVTRGRRWGPGGKGDTSGGCRCGVDGKRCHPSCGYCH